MAYRTELPRWQTGPKDHRVPNVVVYRRTAAIGDLTLPCRRHNWRLQAGVLCFGIERPTLDRTQDGRFAWDKLHRDGCWDARESTLTATCYSSSNL